MEEKYVEVCPFSNESLRCKIFLNCHDCLVDYANSKESFTSFSLYSRSIISKKEKENIIKELKEATENEENLEKQKIKIK